MNRLIIIGNGFDLAHGMKTSFKDFITDYYNNAVNTFIDKNVYDDALLKMSFKQSNGYFIDKQVVKLDKTFDMLTNFEKKDEVIVTQSLLLKNIKSKLEYSNWVDIEIEYFSLLKSIRGTIEVSVDELNIQFACLKEKLIEYLQRQEKEHAKKVFDLDPMVNRFTEEIISEEIFDSEDNTEPDSLYFLNFNYTNTLEPYFIESGKRINSIINYIHGNLNGDYGEPIFGFGDEFDKDYLLFEDLKDNDYYTHIKSFEYSKNRNYFKLLSFLESDDFQVHIYGHSCGLSDRTMLRTIFENKYCRSIKIFFYEKNEKEDDFTEKTFDIYRHFEDKGEMRKKIVPYDVCDAMPQPEKVMEIG
tara:strand:+ start:46463 stop:47536 length:1074 start_codon:yes stop_codon:yes gene_type:complete